MSFFRLGAVLAGLGVVLGAFGAHALRERLAPDRLDTFQTAVDYQVIHALGLLAVAWLAERRPGARAPRIAGWLFALGTLIFSGSLYALALSGARWLGAVTPLGGAAFIGGWAALAIGARGRT